MDLTFAPADAAAIALHVIDQGGLDDWLADQPDTVTRWVRATGFAAQLGSVALIPDAQGGIAMALAGYGTPETRARGRFHLAGAAAHLPEGTYTLHGLDPTRAAEESLGWLLSHYSFDRYRTQKHSTARLIAPEGVDAARIESIAAGEALTRDLINIPASDMGPAELEGACATLATRHGASIEVIRGEALLDRNFPMIHTVGRASARAPRLIDMRWGDSGPTLTLVGKGVCFDTGGLNLKPASGMGLMKKDMGGAATVLGLAQMIMALDLPLRLRVLIPAVENSVAGNAFRPGDILTARNGLTVEARVAVGGDIAPYFTGDARFATALDAAAERVADPVWRMPFHAPYESMIEPGIADLDTAPAGGMAGSITAALFLRRFAGGLPYTHFDIYAWQPKPAPARPKGGVGMGARALLDALPEVLGL